MRGLNCEAFNFPRMLQCDFFLLFVLCIEPDLQSVNSDPLGVIDIKFFTLDAPVSETQDSIPAPNPCGNETLLP